MKRLAAQFGVGALLAVALLWFVQSQLLAHLDGGWASVRGAFASLPAWAIAAYALTFLGVHVTRVGRWVLQVRPLGERDTAMVTSVCAVGYAAIVLFPFRLGELVRPFLLARQSTNVSFSAALGTAVVERILDGLFITALFFITIATAPVAPPDVIRSAGWLSLAVFGGATFGLILFAWQRNLALGLLRMTFGVLDRLLERAGKEIDLVGKLVAMMDGFLEGTRSLRNDGTLWTFGALTLVYWGINAFGIWLLAVAFGLPLPWYAGVGLLAVLVVGIMAPSPPGLVGTFQAALAAGLLLYLPGGEYGAETFAFALTMNGLQLIVQVGFAVPFLSRVGVGFGDLAALQQEAAEQTNAVT